jgi:hypothetical protein
MKTANVLAAAAFAVASISLVGQQPNSSEPQQSSPPPPAAEQTSPATQPNPSTATPAAEMSPVNGELIQKLDSKTAKTGDSITIKTKSAVTTADGTQIPKGSKLVGRVMGVKASGPENANSQVALQFDHAELKSGQSVPIHSEIQSLAPSDSDASSAPSPMAPAPSAPQAGGSPAGSQSSAQPQTSSGAGPAADPNAGNAGPAAGTVVARTGNIAIRTTSIPGVLLAINEPGQQDPRMAQSSGILLGAKRDIHLDEGTNVIIGVAATGSVPGGN